MLRLIQKNQTYYVEPSKEPTELGEYVVVYKSRTEHGFGEGRVYKGTFKKCKKIAKILREREKKYGV